MRQRLYSKSVAISEEDLNFLRDLKAKKGNKKTVAGILSKIIKEYETNQRDKKI